jgi:predicted alpha/beta-hydrolase family hydrolase
MADMPAIAEERFTSGEPPVSAVRYPAATGVPATAVTVVLAHGAGAGMAHPFMLACARGLAARGCDAVTFNFPYMERRAQTGKASAPNPAPQLEACYRALIATLAGRGCLDGRTLVIGGKSMGGRIASQLAVQCLVGCTGLVFLGYPLHPAGKKSALRDKHLDVITSPMLFVQGTRDALCDLSLLRPVLARLGPRATLHVVEGGDHSLVVPKSTQRTREGVALEVADAIDGWLATRLGPTL